MSWWSVEHTRKKMRNTSGIHEKYIGVKSEIRTHKFRNTNEIHKNHIIQTYYINNTDTSR